jgi:hypothetical protein
MFWQESLGFANARIDRINTFLVKLMLENTALEGGYEPFAQFMWDMYLNIANCYEGKRTCKHNHLLYFYVYLRFGDRKVPREIYAWIAHKYYPKEMEKRYIDDLRPGWEQWHEEMLTANSKAQYPVPVATVEEVLAQDLEHYHQNNVIIHIGQAALPGKKRYDGWTRKHTQDLPHRLPDLPARFIPEDERKRILEWCLVDLREEDRRSDLNLLALFDHLEELCYLLRKPENHIKIASGQYVEKQVHVRQVHDMSDEMAQELSNLTFPLCYFDQISCWFPKRTT